MKYEIMIRSIPNEKVSISEKHAGFMVVMDKIPEPWGFGGNGWPSVPDCGRELLAESKLTRHLGSGVRGSIIYRYRGGLGDAGMFDDFMKIEFNPAKHDYPEILKSIFPVYIAAFSAYLGFIGDCEWGLSDWEEEKRIAPNSRYSAFRIYPVHYFGNILCHRIFKKSPEDMIQLLSNECEHVEILNEGVFLVTTYKIVTKVEADAINERLWSALRMV